MQVSLQNILKNVSMPAFILTSTFTEFIFPLEYLASLYYVLTVYYLFICEYFCWYNLMQSTRALNVKYVSTFITPTKAW